MKNLSTVLGWFKYVCLISLAAAAIALAAKNQAYFRPAVITLFASLALYFMSHPFLKRFAFTIWVFAFVATSIFYYQSFIKWGDYPLSKTITPLLQIIMFGMGTTLSLKDFAEVLKRPWAIFIGIAAQFVIMPLSGFVLATVIMSGREIGFTPETFTAAMAAGIVLIGCCPSGVASNVMCYLAGGDVAVSVTVTSCTTLIAPFMTPLLMKYLAGELIKIYLLSMMFEIINMIIVPIIAGVIAHRILHNRHKIMYNAWVLLIIAVAGIIATIIVSKYVPSALYTYKYTDIDPKTNLPVTAIFVKDGVIFGLALLSIVTLSQLVVRVLFKGPENWMDKVLPTISMLGICFIIAVITANSIKGTETQKLKSVIPYLFGATLIHNALGYFLGYWMARAARLNERVCRAVAFEVGMQNGGMASALAMGILNNAQTALAPAFFGPWQNISGSVLATWWHKKPVQKPVTIKQK